MPSRKRLKNIGELADLAGVSRATVSRALDNSPLISLKTRERIQQLASDYDFRLNPVARNLRAKRTNAIGVVIPLGHDVEQHVSDPFFMRMIGLLADGLAEQGLDLVLTRVIPTGDDWLETIVKSGRVDGVILIGQSDQHEVIDHVGQSYKPLVVWGGYEDTQTHCSVGTDNRTGGYEATHHLIDQGCKNILFLGDYHIREIRHRYEGYERAMLESGIGAHRSRKSVHLDANIAYKEILDYLSEAAVLPDGIFAASDVIAMSVIRAASDLKIALPDELKIIGFDGLELSQRTVPSLSTIEQDLAEGARQLVALLLRRMNGEETESIVLPPRLVARRSSGE